MSDTNRNHDERIRHLEAEIDRLKRGRLEYQRPVTLESLTHTMPAGHWKAYTPATPTASSGTFTTVSAACRTTTFGKIRVYSGLVYIEDKGTADGTLRVPIPSGTPQSFGGGKWAGFGHNHENKACDVSLSPSNSYLEILLYDGTTAIASYASISFTIVYEIK